MELPNDVWDTIVKKSLKTDEEIIKDKTYYQLSHLMSEIKLRQNLIIRNIKKKINKYDILDIYCDGVYHHTGIVIDKLSFDNPKIRMRHTLKINETTKTIMGEDYINCFRGGYTDIIKCEFKIVSTEEERKNKNIEIANTLKVGDSFCYSRATVPEYLRHYYYYGDRVNELNRVGVVRYITKNKIVIDSNIYIDKSKVLFKCYEV